MSFGTHTRGDTFRRTFTLGNEWEGSDFDELWFTVRKDLPSPNVADDASVLAQVTMTGGGITFDPGDDTLGTVRIAPASSRTWPVGTVHADLQGKAGDDIYTIQRGTITVNADVTRSQ